MMSAWKDPPLEYAGYGRPMKPNFDPPRSIGYTRAPMQPENYYASPNTSLTYIATPITPSYSPSSQSPAPPYPPNNYGNPNQESRHGQSFSYGGGTVMPRDERRRRSPDSMEIDYTGSPLASDPNLYGPGRAASSSGNTRPPRRPSNRDEFDGVNQYLPPLNPAYVAAQERDIPHLPTNLVVQEQDEILSQVNDRLSRCAYDFVAKYEFPIPVDPKMRPVTRPEDREWTEWVYLLKRLATKRRIPARLLYQGQIKQLVTILENSLEMRHAAKHQSRPLKDDRNVLQLISAGIQVAKILKDAPAVEYLDQLYIETDAKIASRASKSARYR